MEVGRVGGGEALGYLGDLAVSALPMRNSKSVSAKFPLQHVTVHRFHESGGLTWGTHALWAGDLASGEGDTQEGGA